MRVPNYRNPIVSLLEGYLWDIQRPFSRFNGIQWSVIDVSKSLINFEIEIYGNCNAKKFQKEEEQRGVVQNVRNAMLGQLGDLVPCPRFGAAFSHSSIKLYDKLFNGPFYNPSVDEFLLRSSSVPIIEIVMECRERYRPVFKAAWEGLSAN